MLFRRTPHLPFAVLLALMLVMLLAACGGGEEEGIDLQLAGQRAEPTATPTPEPDTGDADSTGTADLPGRLLIRRGRVLETLDFATGEFTRYPHPDGGDGINSASPVLLNDDHTLGTFVSFPNFGIIDLANQQSYEILNTGSFPAGLRISPDGRWLGVQTGGGFVSRLQLLSVNNEERYDIAASSQYGFIWSFTPESEFLWTTTEEDPVVQRFDPALGESVPLDSDTIYEVLTYTELDSSPDGTRIARVPRAPGLAAAGDDPENCFDSYVSLVDLPLTIDDPFREGDIIYSEARLVATSPQWLDSDRLLFVKLGEGTCGDVQGDSLRQIMLLDLSADSVQPVPVAGPIGNETDPSDYAQTLGRSVTHLYSPSPDGRFIAWVAGGPDADETVINVTEVATGETRAIFRVTAAETLDAVEFLERTLIRQVLWID